MANPFDITFGKPPMEIIVRPDKRPILGGHAILETSCFRNRFHLSAKMPIYQSLDQSWGLFCFAK